MRSSFFGLCVLPATLGIACEPVRDPIERPPLDGSDYQGAAGVSGWVCSPSGDFAVGGATVYIDTDGDGLADVSTTTDSTGQFTIEGLTTGTYTIVVQKGENVVEQTVDYVTGQSITVGGMCFSGVDRHIAVVNGAYDAIENLLDLLGFQYTLYDSQTSLAYQDLLGSKTELAKYDVVFLDCGMDETWTEGSIKGQVIGSLQDFVSNGGSLYASDWAALGVELPFPDVVDFYGDDQSFEPRQGSPGNVTATVLSPAFQTALGADEATISYNLGAWVVVDGAGADSEVLLTGDPTVESGTLSDVPLAIRRDYDGGGSVLYTTFHNEAQASDDMLSMLFEVVLTL